MAVAVASMSESHVVVAVWLNNTAAANALSMYTKILFVRSMDRIFMRYSTENVYVPFPGQVKSFGRGQGRRSRERYPFHAICGAACPHVEIRTRAFSRRRRLWHSNDISSTSLRRGARAGTWDSRDLIDCSSSTTTYDPRLFLRSIEFTCAELYSRTCDNCIVA